MGYDRAGFEVEGVDIKPQPHYPFKFYQGDALTFPLEGYDAYHASPPCQAWSQATAAYRNRGYEYPELIAPIRERLIHTGLPYVIENVVPAPLTQWLKLCGTFFGLRTYRHRIFETNFLIFQPGHLKHYLRSANKQRKEAWANGQMICVTGDAGVTIPREVMAIEWMNGEELSQAIPPAYTEYIGKYLLQAASHFSSLAIGAPVETASPPEPRYDIPFAQRLHGELMKELYGKGAVYGIQKKDTPNNVPDCPTSSPPGR
jgi:DNA (cytosine-5)-methyltransferase 1